MLLLSQIQQIVCRCFSRGTALCFVMTVFVVANGPILKAGQINVLREQGQLVYELRQGATVVKIAPQAGANVYSIRVNEVEYLHQPDTPEKLAGVGCGVPVLYPTPNRVKDGRFQFEGRTVQFPIGKNAKWFIHGVVNRHEWTVQTPEVSQDHAALTCVADFSTNSKLYELFPFAHALKMKVEVRDARVRWTYTVDNTKGDRAVPFGFALHPYFVYHGAREATYVTIPASHWMEAVERLPTGKLVAGVDFKYVLGEPFSLAKVDLDDVFWGMRAAQPTRIEFREARRNITIRAADEFSHLVVWTPERPYFGIESQTCSTDAHNLYAKGLVEESHLQVCAPGGSMSSWVQYEFAGE